MQEDGCVNILSLLNENVPAPAPDNWKIGRKEIVAVYSEDIWYNSMMTTSNKYAFTHSNLGSEEWL